MIPDIGPAAAKWWVRRFADPRVRRGRRCPRLCARRFSGDGPRYGYVPCHAGRTEASLLNDIRRTFLESLEPVRPLLAADETALAWDSSSVLREMTVGGLVGHLLRAITTVVTYLEQPSPRDAPNYCP
jgi:hypothetical protein